MNRVISFLNRHPWIYVVLAFGLLIAAWSTLISLALEHTPEKIEIQR